MKWLKLFPVRSALYAVGVFFASLLFVAIYYLTVTPVIMQFIASLQANFPDNPYLNTLFETFKFATMLSGLIALSAVIGWLYVNTRKREIVTYEA